MLRLGGFKSALSDYLRQLTRETQQVKLKLDMPKKKKQEEAAAFGFSQFLAEPTISAALVVFGLITLIMSLVEFGQAVY